MKRLVFTFLMIGCLFSLCSCGNSNPQPVTEVATEVTTETTTETTAEPEIQAKKIIPFVSDCCLTNNKSKMSVAIFGNMSEIATNPANKTDTSKDYQYSYVNHRWVTRPNGSRYQAYDLTIYDYCSDDGKPDGFIDFIDVNNVNGWTFEGIDFIGKTISSVPQKYGSKKEIAKNCYQYNLFSKTVGEYRLIIRTDDAGTIRSYAIGQGQTGFKESLEGYNAFVNVPKYISEDGLIINGFGVVPSDTVSDGRDFFFGFINSSEKDIKYLTIIATPYNAVDDPVNCTVTNESTKKFELTGPVLSQEERVVINEETWFNPNIVNAKIESIKIIYMDNSEDEFQF